MKITDYGLWFRDWGTKIFTKIPKGKTNQLFLNGIYMGAFYDDIDYYVIYTSALNEIGFMVNPDSPGKKDRICWNFPENYIPSDTDFEEIP